MTEEEQKVREFFYTIIDDGRLWVELSAPEKYAWTLSYRSLEVTYPVPEGEAGQ